jgi:hypothetical protein
VYIIANVRHTNNIKVSNNGKMTEWYVNFLPATTLKTFKDNEIIPKYSFKFMSTDILSTRIHVDTYLSGKTVPIIIHIYGS